MPHLANRHPTPSVLSIPQTRHPFTYSENDSTMTQSPLQLKIILIGDMSVGKTCLYKRFFDRQWSFEKVAATYGVDLQFQTMEVDGRKVKLGIWDTAGMEKFRVITAPFYRGAQGVILVYDITDKTSFDALAGWLAEIDQHVPSTTPKMIVGNKLDQEHSRQVSTSDGELFASRNGALFREASAKTSAGVTEVFEDLVKQILNAEDQTKSVDIFRWPQAEVVKLYAQDPASWWNSCKC
ncbi:GTP-binding protein yptV3 [Pisolithus orientalis]|uniref:GTP-binding protein yptV3 n=1 Tax=Pisolithus orientalis TaxID=936130 RepID=UPI0022243410|nr:GTP-binding protein yptV3 [Pisolithus orientalis]KAI5998511.1 GTP-binding protein yptV3 [Pisolithus orientalis]